MHGPTDRRILLFGANGQLGYELRRTMSSYGEVIALDRAGADLSRPESLRAVARSSRPQIIINAAAYTSVDKAETEPTIGNLVNAASPGVLAEEAQALGACLIHYSTDYVFDGTKDSPYDEEDLPNPLSEYGRSKYAGEQAVARACERHLIFRTSWLLGVHGRNFLKTILRLAAERENLRVVADQYGAPTSAALVAEVTAAALLQLLNAPEGADRWGLYHVAAAGETTWHAYARHVIDRARKTGVPLKATPDSVTPISTAEFHARAARPANSRLNTLKVRSAFALGLPGWEQGVNQVLDQLISDEKR